MNRPPTPTIIAVVLLALAPIRTLVALRLDWVLVFGIRAYFARP